MKKGILKGTLIGGLGIIIGYLAYHMMPSPEVQTMIPMEVDMPMDLGDVYIQIGNGEEDKHVVVLKGHATKLEAGTTVFTIEGHDKIKSGMVQLYDAPHDGTYPPFYLSLQGDVNGQEFFGTTSAGANVFYKDGALDLGGGLIITDNTIVPYFSQADTTDVSIDTPFKLPK